MVIEFVQVVETMALEMEHVDFGVMAGVRGVWEALRLVYAVVVVVVEQALVEAQTASELA